MLTHGNIVADSAGMVRVTHVAPGVVRTAFGVEESVPGRACNEGKTVGSVQRMLVKTASMGRIT